MSHPIKFDPMGPLASVEYFGEFLVRHNLVEAHALDDPEAYDEITRNLRGDD